MTLASATLAVMAQQPAPPPKPQEEKPDPNAPEARAERDLDKLGEQATQEQAAWALDDALQNIRDHEGPIPPDDPVVDDLRDAVRYYLRAHRLPTDLGELMDLVQVLWGAAESEVGKGGRAAFERVEKLQEEGRFGSTPWNLAIALGHLRYFKAKAAAARSSAPAQTGGAPGPAQPPSGPVKAQPKPGVGTITGSVHVRERANGDESLLVTVTARESQASHVSFRLPSRFELSLTYAPPDWKLVQKDKALIVSGPALPLVNLRFDTARGSGMIPRLTRQGGETLALEVGPQAGAGPTYKLGLKVSLLPKVELLTSLEDAITLPPQVTPGEMVFATPAPNLRAGSWRLLGPDTAFVFSKLDGPAVPASGEVEAEVARSLSLAVRYVHRSAAAEPARLSYRDEWNEELVNGVAGWDEAPAQKCKPTLTGGAPQAFAGQDACVTGCFAHPDRMAGFLLLDGEVPLKLQAASPTTIRLRIPDGVKPGAHFIRWHPALGIGGEPVPLRVLQLQGSIDQNELWKGQSTTMRLGILGSDRPVQLNVVNHTPGVIDVQGGARQVVTTSGGADNAATRQVRGIMRGNFNISYSLDQPACGGPPGSR
ncbi:MAG: hypothetical protein AB7Q30_20915 [Vicinamibacteria bacterium]